MPDRSPTTLSPAEELFAGWLGDREDERAKDLETLCREHPEEAAELRRLWVTWQGIKRVLERAGFGLGSLSLARKIYDEYGSGVDPEVSLDAGEGIHAPSDALLERLAEHTLKASRYQLQGEIARGGMGTILKVFDEDLRRNLAMKVILGKAEDAPSGGTPPVDRRLLARFLEEAQITGQLDHPGIVPVHELGLDGEGRVYFTMKLVKGRDLKEVFDLVSEEKEGWSEARALGVLLKVCEAMAYAHKKGVIHRDLKPANVMVGSFGEVYVMDWGLARVEGREDRHDVRLRVEGTPLTSLKTERREEREEAPDSPLCTMDGDVVGTPAYMPPEQARGEVKRLGSRTDVYAIGAMLYHRLARQMPYVPAGARISNRTVLMRVVEGPPPSLHAIRKDIPVELEAISAKAMGREPRQRYGDTLELAEDLRAYLEGRVVKAHRTGPAIELRKWVVRNRTLASTLGTTVLAVIALAITIPLGLARHRVARAQALRNEEASVVEEVFSHEEVLLDENKLAAVQRLVRRVVAKQGSAEDHYRLALGLFRPRWWSEPLQIGNRVRVEFDLECARWADAPDLGVLTCLDVRLNGSPLPEHAFRTVASGVFAFNADTSYELPVSPGLNTLDALLSFSFFEIPESNKRSSARVGLTEDGVRHLEVFGAPIQLTMPRLHVTSLPSDQGSRLRSWMDARPSSIGIRSSTDVESLQSSMEAFVSSPSVALYRLQSLDGPAFGGPGSLRLRLRVPRTRWVTPLRIRLLSGGKEIEGRLPYFVSSGPQLPDNARVRSSASELPSCFDLLLDPQVGISLLQERPVLSDVNREYIRQGSVYLFIDIPIPDHPLSQVPLSVLVGCQPEALHRVAQEEASDPQERIHAFLEFTEEFSLPVTSD